MKLDEYKKDSYEFSKLTSDLVRQFAFAGIAIIWIFKFDKVEQHLIPQELIRPLLFFVATLAFDLFQYLIPTIIWTIFFRYYEKKNKGKTDVNIKASGWLSSPGWVCFILKTITLAIGYFYVVSFLISKI
jgi:predicted membrane protein